MLRRKGGEAVGALYHDEVGDISVVYGSDQYGLAHIAKKHPEVLNNLQGAIDGMIVTRQSDNRIVLESDTHRAVISKMLGNEPTSNWLLTAYEKKNPASASSSDIETEPEGKQNGTATLQNEISTDEVSENIEEKQNIEDNSQIGSETPSPLQGTPPKQGSEGELAIPTDKKGKKLYERAPVEATVNDIYNDPELDEEEADAYVQARIDGATKRIAQLEKKKPKMGEDIQAFKAEKAKWQANLEAEQASLAYWQGVQESVPEMRRKERAKRQMEADLAEQERERQARAEQAQRAEERGRNRGDYRKAMAQWEDAPGSFHEYVAQALLGGDYKMRWDDNGSTRGLGSHTTGRRRTNRQGETVTSRGDEFKALSWLIDNNNGISPEALADRLWNEYTGSYGEDMAEGRPLDVVLDVVTSMPTPQMMWDYVKGEHDARMEAEQGAYEEQYSEEEMEAMERDAMYREKYGVGEDEYWANEAELEEKGERAEEAEGYEAERNDAVADARGLATEAVIASLVNSGIEVVEATDAMAEAVLGMANPSVELSAKQKRALETASVQEEHQPTVVSSADGTKVLKNLDSVASEYEEKSNQPKTFLGDVAKAIGAERKGSGSQYVTFETKNGKVVTIRLSNHNAKVSNFDNNGEFEGISIVVSAKGNNGITNDGNAHIVEHYYDAIKLRRAEGKPLAEIVRSIKQALYSGEFTDTTGLAERQEVNLNEIEAHIVYHGSGAKFDAFDHSHMGEGEGAQAYGWGTYVTEVEGIGRAYAKAMADKAISEKHRENRIINKLAKETLESRNGNKEEALANLRGLLNESWSDKKRVRNQIKVIETGRNLPEGKAYKRLYTVEIPEDNGSNYLSWDGEISDEIIEGLQTAIETELGEDIMMLANLKHGQSGELLYKKLERALGSDKAASEFLARNGFVGIKYPAQYRSGGRADGASNYVIFNEADAKIVNRVEFLRSPQGVVYGWTDGTKVYLTKDGMNPETPIHEYTHIWAKAMMQGNPEGWQSVKDLLRGTPIWNEVINDPNYSGIIENEDAVASEALSRLSGKENARRMEQEARKMIDEAKGIMAKAEAVTLIERMRKALQEFWSWVGKNLFDIKEFGSIEEVTDRVLYDLIENSELRVESGETATSGTATTSNETTNANELGENLVFDSNKASEFIARAEKRIKEIVERLQMLLPNEDFSLDYIGENGEVYKNYFARNGGAFAKLRSLYGTGYSSERDKEISGLIGELADISHWYYLNRAELNNEDYDATLHNHGFALKAINEFKNSNKSQNEKSNKATKTVNENSIEKQIIGERGADGNLFQYFAGSLSELISRAKASAQGLIKKVIAPVSSRLKNDLAQQGVELDDNYKHVIDNNAIRHTLNNHSGKSEEERGQIPVTESDFDRITDVVENYDSIAVDNGKRGDINIRYSKTYADGTTIYVEEKRNKRKELAMVTMWKMKNSTLTDANRTETTPISDLSGVSTDKVSDKVGDVQEEGVLFRDGGAFYSNAEEAVLNIKQDKATPEQWLAMIQKNGGLKAGEDKWLGLSEWLTEKGKSKDERGKSLVLTKQEVLEFINQNKIVIEEVNYSTDEALSSVQSEFDELTEVLGGYGEAFDEMANRYGDDFKTAIWYDEVGQLHFEDGYEDYGEYISDYNGINETRLNYTTEGLDNKREIALVVPTVDPYNAHDEIHFGDAGDGRAVAWVRFGETTDAKGNRVLVIDEIQSKRHQDGREKGYRGKDEAQREARIAEIRNRLREITDRMSDISDLIPGDIKGFLNRANYRKTMPENAEYEQLRAESNRLHEELDSLSLKRNAVPDAPFEKNWHELAMKRMLRYAAENGYDKVAWTTGEQQAERYDLSKVVESIDYRMDTDGTILIDTYGSHGYQIESVPTQFKNEAEIAEVFGKEIANTIVLNLNAQQEKVEALNQKLRELKPKMKEVDVDSVEYDNLVLEFGEISRERHEAQKKQTIEGEDLRIGGEGMKGFYDKMLPSFMNKYGKKWGVKVGEVELPDVGDNGLTMHSIDVTDAMRESVMEGQPMFRERDGNPLPVNGTPPKQSSRGELGYSDAEVSMANDPVAKVMGKSQRTKAQQAKFAERERKAMRGKVDELAGKMGIGDRVEVIENGELRVENETPSPLRGTPPKQGSEGELGSPSQNRFSQRKARAKGWFDPRTGKIVINLSNHTSVADVERTLLHEAVAHYGLRELFGGRFDTFLDNVYNNAEGEIKAQINAIASSKGVSTRVATEEYLAELAEDTNFEYLERQTSFWQKLKQLFMDMLESIGWNYKGPELSDNELRYILWRSYENMVNPGRHRSILGMAEDVVMREKFGVGNFATTDTAQQVAENGEVYSEVPTAEEAVESYKERFSNVGEVKVFDNENALKEYLSQEHNLDKNALDAELDGVKGSPAAYDNIKNKILIFAWKNQNIYFNLIHEHCHKAVNNLGGADSFNELIDELKDIDPKLWKSINRCYDEEVGDEMLAYMVQYVVSADLIPEMQALLSPKAQTQLNEIINYIGYENNTNQQVVERFNTRETESDIKFYQNRIRNIIRRRNEKVGRINGEESTVGKGNEESNGNVESEKSIGSSKGVLFRDGESDGTREEYNKRVRRPNKSKTKANKVGRWGNLSWRLKEAYQDSMLSLKALQEIIAKKYGIEEIPSWMNAYMQENLMSSRNKAANEVYERDFFNPLLEAVKWFTDRNVDREDLVRYMFAKHGLERNRVLAERDAKRTADEAVKDGGDWQKAYNEAYAENRGRDYSGLTALTGEEDVAEAEAIAEQMVEEFEYRFKDSTKELWEKVNAATKETLRKEFEGGLMSREQYEQVQSMFEYYIPLRGWDEEVAENVYEYLNDSKPLLASNLKTAEGRTSLADDPIATIGLMSNTAIANANRNKMKQAFYFFVTNNPSDVVSVTEQWYVENVATGKT